jgi:hypothetical protein
MKKDLAEPRKLSSCSVPRITLSWLDRADWDCSGVARCVAPTHGGQGPAPAGQMCAAVQNVTGMASNNCRHLCRGKIGAAANARLLHFGFSVQAGSTEKMATGAGLVRVPPLAERSDQTIEED